MTAPIDTVLARHPEAKKQGDRYRARCHAHVSKSGNSLSIRELDDGTVLMHDFGGCDIEDVLRVDGLTKADLFPRQPEPVLVSSARRNGRARPQRRWSVVHPKTGDVVTHVREDLPAENGRKQKAVWWERDGKKGLGGLKTRDLGLYRGEALAGADVAVLVEGEACADALAEALAEAEVAVVATVTGAEAIPSDEVLACLLPVARTVVWADSDRPGRRHARGIADRLLALGHQDVRMLDAFPDRDDGSDVADLIAAGATPEAVADLIAGAAPCSAPEILSAALKGGVPAESILPFHTARAIGLATPAEPDWIAEGLVAAGAITEVDGKIKAAGKTTWATHLSGAVLDGAPFMGSPTSKSPVVYLTEQPPASFREALRRAGLLDRDDFVVLFWHEAVGVPWPEVVTAARVKAQEIGARLLVVDTLPQFAGVRGDAENNAGAALEAVAPLQEAAGMDGLGVLILRHERKSGGDVGDSGRGSSAYSGAVDIVLQLRRAEGNGRPSLRVIESLSRFDQTPDKLVVELTPEGYVALGDEEAVAEQEARNAILKAAPTSEAEAIPEKDLLAAAEVKRTVGQEVIRAHLDCGDLRRVGEGRRGDPYKYWRPTGAADKVSAATQGVPAESNGHGPAGEPGQPELHSAATPPLSAAESNGHAASGGDADWPGGRS